MFDFLNPSILRYLVHERGPLNFKWNTFIFLYFLGWKLQEVVKNGGNIFNTFAHIKISTILVEQFQYISTTNMTTA